MPSIKTDSPLLYEMTSLLRTSASPQVASGKWHGIYGVPVPETGRNKKMGRTEPAGKKNSSGRSPLADERIAQLSCNMIGRDRSTQKVGVENRLGRSGNKRPGTRRS
ncbi:hypothetical protein TNCV_859371 [Trichonephila clavipes]|nr:hypothetical protein TNCV_859371 [Trichonephila clavipes]